MRDIRKDYLPFGRPNISDDEIAAVTRVLRSGWIGMGSETIAFEKELQFYLGTPEAITVNSCTSALFLSLLVSGIGPGDEVICPSLTWCSTVNAALYLGARPVFCDVDPHSMCVTPETILPCLTPKTKAVMVVHYGGYAVNVKAIRACLPSSVQIIEDAAHALGSRYPDGTAVGSSGNPTCFSFYANKNLSTGEGGAIALADNGIANRLRSLRQHGMQADAWKRFTNPDVMLAPDLMEMGYKMNYTDLQASLGRVQLRRQPELVSIRKHIAEYYYSNIPEILPGVRFQDQVTFASHARHLFVMLVPNDSLLSRNQLLLEMRQRNVGAAIHYPPLHKMGIYKSYSSANLCHTEDICKRTVTLPISASMTLDDTGYVLKQLERSLKSRQTGGLVAA